MPGVTRGPFDDMHDDPAQVGEFVSQRFGMAALWGSRQRRAGYHRIGTAALVVVEGENHLRLSRCRQGGAWSSGHGNGSAAPATISWNQCQMFYESEGCPAGGQNRRGQCLCVKPVDDGQHAGSLCREEGQQSLLFRAI